MVSTLLFDASAEVFHDRAANCNADSVGTRALYETVSRSISTVRANGCVPAGWNARMEAEHKKNNQ